MRVDTAAAAPVVTQTTAVETIVDNQPSPPASAFGTFPIVLPAAFSFILIILDSALNEKYSPNLIGASWAPKFLQLDEHIDQIAVGVCLYTKMLVSVCMLTFNTIAAPYCMAAFRWTSAQTVLYVSIIMGLVGLNFIFWNGVYIFFDLRKR